MMKSIATPRFPLSARRPALRALAASAALGVLMASAAGAQNMAKGGVDADLWEKASADPRLAEVTAKLDAEVKALIAQDPVLEADLRKEMEYISGLKDQGEIAKALAGVNERYGAIILKDNDGEMMDEEMMEEMLQGYADVYIDIFAEYGIALEAAIGDGRIVLITPMEPPPPPPPPTPLTVALNDTAFAMRVTEDQCDGIAAGGVSDMPFGLHVNATATFAGYCRKYAEKVATVPLVADVPTVVEVEADLNVNVVSGGAGATSCSVYAGVSLLPEGGGGYAAHGIGSFTVVLIGSPTPSQTRRVALALDPEDPAVRSVDVRVSARATALGALFTVADCHADVSNVQARYTSNPG